MLGQSAGHLGETMPGAETQSKLLELCHTWRGVPLPSLENPVKHMGLEVCFCRFLGHPVGSASLWKSEALVEGLGPKEKPFFHLRLVSDTAAYYQFSHPPRPLPAQHLVLQVLGSGHFFLQILPSSLDQTLAFPPPLPTPLLIMVPLATNSLCFKNQPQKRILKFSTCTAKFF